MKLSSITNTMMIQNNMSIASAYDEAIKVSARRIHLASRPMGQEESGGLKKNSDCDNDSDTSTCESDIESHILFLEEKKRILEKAETRRRHETAYIASSAHDILNDRELSSSRSRGSSSVWSEAKAIIDEYQNGAGINNEEDEGSDNASSSSFLNEKKRLYSSPSLPSSNYNTLLSTAGKFVSSLTSPNKKRPKIDLSLVDQVSSTRFDAYNDENASNSHINCCIISETTRCQQASDMQFATDSRHWISQVDLQQIYTLTNAAIAKHRLSLIATTNPE
mmetsp:Transcript_16020/g.16006  ORF Transcript_16020/g.16006 Transcript_16020/m.16006 type:complete len:278 (+) Transcript_16020:53-886(+)